METEKCVNCGSVIGSLETPMIWKDNLVCSVCHARLNVEKNKVVTDNVATSSSSSKAAKEQTLYEATHHWVFFLRPSVILISCITFGIGLIYFIMVFKTTKFIVTNKRVIKQFGIGSRDSWELMLKQVSAINVNRGIFDRIFGTGQILITAAGGTSEVFLAINNPKDFQQAVVDAIP